MVQSIKYKLKLHNGIEMPQFGLGVYKVEDGQQVVNTIKTALQLGYRLIDTASFYKNEEGVGQAIRESGISREEIFVTTKVWNTDQGYEATLKAFEKSMEKMGLQYLDLYLIHWPVKGKYLETWRALEHLYSEGKVKAIGVCNFQVHHLKDLIENSKEKPVVNQVELHPLLSQEEIRAYCAEQNIKVEAWAPIARGLLLKDETLNTIGQKYGKTAAQVILSWHLQNGVIIIPKSITPSRIKENSEIFDFELSEEEMKQINTLNKNERTGPDPDNFSF